ncbi:MAG: response regulator transcription factor [Candidatus Cyclobacteriaceae bacterium M2_1C_046]
MSEKNIFIVEDDHDFLFIYKTILKQEYTVHLFEEADDYFFERLQEIEPDLLLLDWQIPTANADKVLKVINSYDTKTKVLVVSALDDIHDLIADDADAVLQKPVHMHIMQDTVRELINANPYQRRKAV